MASADFQPTETQGTKGYLVDLTTDLGYSESTKTNDPEKVKTAIAGAKEIDLIIELGDIDLGTKATSEVTLQNKDQSYTVGGSTTAGEISPQLIYDAADVEGQKILKDMWRTGEKKKMIIVFDNQITPVTGNPTSVTFTALVTKPTLGVAKDNIFTYTPTIKMCDLPVLTEAS